MKLKSTMGLLCLSLFLPSCSSSKDDVKEIEDQVIEQPEKPIYNKDGKPVAYSYYPLLTKEEKEQAPDPITAYIYIWDTGKSPCYVTLNDSNRVYGVNGSPVAWVKKGIYYDLDGYRIGFDEGAFQGIPLQPQSPKYVKYMLHGLYGKKDIPITPIFSHEWSKKSLVDCLMEGLPE